MMSTFKKLERKVFFIHLLKAAEDNLWIIPIAIKRDASLSAAAVELTTLYVAREAHKIDAMRINWIRGAPP